MGTITMTDGLVRNFTVYAGAGQCDITKGTMVGTGSIKFYPSQGYCTIALNVPDNYVSQIHAFIGTTKLPMDKSGGYITSPGRFPLNKEVTTERSWTYTLPSGCTSGSNVYAVVHLSVATC